MLDRRAVQTEGRVHSLTIPSAGSSEVFAGSTAGVRYWDCRVHSLSPLDPQPPAHRHDEEELVIVLDGELRLDLPEAPWVHAGEEPTLRAGHVAFLPPRVLHALRARGDRPAGCVTINWRDAEAASYSPLGVVRFDTAAPGTLGEARHAWGARQKQIMAPTANLGALKCHVSTMAPGGGYAPHTDPYDVVIVMLAGEVDTLGERVGAAGVIFYPADSLHGMRNPTDAAARYVVFEFHSARREGPAAAERRPLWVRLADPRRWGRRIRRLLAREP